MLGANDEKAKGGRAFDWYTSSGNEISEQCWTFSMLQIASLPIQSSPGMGPSALVTRLATTSWPRRRTHWT